MVDLRQFNNGLPLQLSLIDEKKEIDEVKDRRFITTEELAIRWRKSPRTLCNQRSANEGVSFFRINGSVLYDLNDVIEYELNNYFKSLANG